MGKGGSVQAEQILMVIKTKEGAGARLSVMEESFLNDASKLERKMATLVHQQLGGNMNFFTDYTKIHEVLSKVGELTEKDDRYGVLPAGHRTRPGMNVEILREERYSGASPATAMQRSWDQGGTGSYGGSSSSSGYQTK